MKILKNGGWFPFLIVGLLLVSVGANVYLLIRATNDPSFAVEPDYYEKAVAWDELQAEKAASDDLGWAMRVEASRDGLEVELHDALGQPVDGAQVEVVAFHNARASERLSFPLNPLGKGAYAIERPFPRAGIWEFRFIASLEADRFLYTTQEELP